MGPPMEFECLAGLLLHPEIVRFADYCRKLAAGRELPARKDFDPAETIPQFGGIYLLEIAPGKNGHEFTPSLFGVYLAVLYDNDQTDIALDKVENSALRDVLYETYERVVAMETPIYIRGKYVWSDHEVGVERLLVPMTGGDGRVTAILGMTVPDITLEEMEAFRGALPEDFVPEIVVECANERGGLRNPALTWAKPPL
jgi:hypothetical protein